MNATNQTPEATEQFARAILKSYRSQLQWTAPERTIHQCREFFLQSAEERTMAEFTQGLKLLLERKYVRRLNDERLELTPAGRAWATE